MAKKKLSNIEIWNARVRDASWYRHVGRQGIHYEFLLPRGSDSHKFYEEAIDVRSKKGNNNRRSSNGNLYRPGSYQPIGDKRYFIYYQKNKMRQGDYEKWLLVLQRREDEKYIRIVQNALNQVMQ